MANEEASALEPSKFGEESLETKSVFANNCVGEIPFGPIGDAEDWELMLPSISDRVCSEYGNHAFLMDEVVFKYMGLSSCFRLPVSKNVFFSFFTVQRCTDWVSFRQTQKMFEVFVKKVRSFKECFFLVRPRSATALDTLFEGANDGVQERRPFFPLCWSQDHFRYEPKDFGRTVANLSVDEIEIRQKL